MDFVALLVAVIALFVAQGKQKRIDDLAGQVNGLKRALALMQPAEAPSPAAPVELAEPQQRSAWPAPDETALASEAVPQPVPAAAERTPPPPPPRPAADPVPPQPAAARRAFDLEKAMGVHLPVWGGAIMLLVAGFFLARMAADNGFFTPTLGVVACAAGALVLLAAAFLVKRLAITNHGQIAAALASAAIGTLYATAFLSSAAFGLTSLFTGFLLSAATLVLALGIAFSFGRPVLIVGLLGGYLAPFFLFADAPGEIVFHLYLAVLLLGGAITCIRKGWWVLLTPMLLLHFAWLAAFLLFGAPFAAPSIATVVSLVLTPAIVFLLSERWAPLPANPEATTLSVALAVLLVVAGAAMTGFGPVYLGGFCALAVLTGLMSLSARSGSAVPTYIAALGWLALLVLWREPDGLPRLAVTIVTLLAIASPLLVAMSRARSASRHAAMLCLVTLLTFVSSMVDLDGWGGLRDLPALWAALALGFAAAAAAGGRLFGRVASAGEADTVRGIFGAAASGYVSLAIVAVVDPAYFALAAALQVLGLALVYRRYAGAHLLTLAAAYAALYFGLLVLSVLAPFDPAALGPVAAYLPGTPPWQAPIVALLLPALAFLAAATVVRASGRALVTTLDAAAVGLTSLAAVFLILPDEGTLRFEDMLVWTSLLGNAVLLLGLVALLAGHRFGRRGLTWSGITIALLMLASLLLAAVLPVYGFWPVWNVPGVALLNVSLTGLVLPGLLALALAWVARRGEPQHRLSRWAFAIAGGLLVLTGVLVDIRHLFHPDLLQGPSGAIERYTYSAGMLLLAFSALLLGTRLSSQPLRYASLVIMLATVAKVFLFDIGGLEGLWRVASFVGMGIALLVTSWFYGRHVFGRAPGAPPAPPPAGEQNTA